MKQRLDQALVGKGLVMSRSQAESYIKLGDVKVDGVVVTKSGTLVSDTAQLEVTAAAQYVSRGALKLDSVAQALKLDFRDKNVLDVGSSTGGFTDYALQHGARKVIAVEVGSNQLHPTLRNNPKVELHEQTDIRDFVISSLSRDRARNSSEPVGITGMPDIVVADVSFISLRDILPPIAALIGTQTAVIAMVKPQFEAENSNLKHKGVIKNDRMRRDILKDFEAWVHSYFVIVDKADSEVRGAKGNQERFYYLRKHRN